MHTFARVCLLAVLAVAVFVVVDARASHRAVHPIGPNEEQMKKLDPSMDSTPNEPLELTPERAAFYAKITKDLEARNYTRPQGANGARGVDISQWAGTSTWNCLKQAGYSFAIVRNYCQTCRVDPNGVHSVANAWAAGISHVDIYLYPSWTCSWSASQQVDQAIDSMGSIPFGQLWFDVEAGGAAGPNTDHAWLVAGVNRAVQRLGAKRIGIYSSKYGWATAMGSYSGFQNYALWYAHYDNNPSFSDFTSFAGWTRPAMKQYNGDLTICNFGVDTNSY